MNYFEVLPSEIIDIIISYADHSTLENFLKTYFDGSIIRRLNVSRILFYRFDRYIPNIDIEFYLKYLNVESLKSKVILNLSDPTIRADRIYRAEILSMPANSPL